MASHSDAQRPCVDYGYWTEDCDVDETRRQSLEKYRAFRIYCLKQLRGTSSFSVYRQLSKLAWHTAVFQTLNEARRLEPDTQVSGPMWDLLNEGYASLMAMGIRRLLDKDKRRISLAWIVDKLEKNRHLLTREFYVCHDGLPYDYEASRDKYYASMGAEDRTKVDSHPLTGPDGWWMAEQMHAEFDRLCGNPTRRRRDDRISKAIIQTMKELLAHDSIAAVEALASKVIAHTVMVKPGEQQVVIPTYEDVSNALEILVGLANFISATIFFDASLGIEPIYSGNPCAGLDQPWIGSNNLVNLGHFWDQLCKCMEAWSSSDRIDNLLTAPARQPTSPAPPQ